MQFRQLGKTGLSTSVLGVGCSRLGSFLSGSSRNEVTSMLHEALDLGVNFFDTADSYGQGDSERLLAKAFRGKRDQIIIETKAGYNFSQTAKVASRFKQPIRKLLGKFPSLKRNVEKARATHISQNFDPKYLVKAVDESLKRLNTDYIDVFMLHDPPSDILKQMSCMEIMLRLRDEGKIRHLGVSCRIPEDGLLCTSMPEVSVIQVPVNLSERKVLEMVLPRAQEENIGVVARQPFSSGEIFRQNSTSAALVTEDKLAFLKQAFDTALLNPSVAVVVVGMSSQQHLRENAQIFK